MYISVLVNGGYMADYTVVEAREKFAEIINRANFAKERIYITRHGKRVAAVVSIEDVAVVEPGARDHGDTINIDSGSGVDSGKLPWEEL